MSDDGQRAQETAEDFGQTVTDQPYHSEFDEAIVWRDRFMSWQSDRMRGRACTEEQIEAMVRKALDMPYAFWIQACSAAEALPQAVWPLLTLARDLHDAELVRLPVSGRGGAGALEVAACPGLRLWGCCSGPSPHNWSK